EKGLVLINYTTGCIFEYDMSHPLGSGIGFKEEDTPKTKGMIAKRNLIGIYNFTNPDVVSPNEILEMYREYNEEQAKVIVAPRSNNDLDAAKLKTEFPKMLSIQESLIKFVFEPNKKTEVKV
ncbi:hypothetical protein HID58_060342, partial [Brassica napus]